MKFTEFLIEMLTDGQKDVVDSWGSSKVASNISQHVIPKGQHRIVIPLEDPNDKPIHRHLAAHGYEITDYKEGKAKDKYGREVKIGKALVATKAPHLLDAFNADRSRETESRIHHDYQVVISRHPYDVAGMSTDRNWDSCMRMTPWKTLQHPHENLDGEYAHKLPDEVRHGTHVAYLTHKGDDTIENPLARIALKPYKEEKSERIILHPEPKLYGSDPASSFEHTVNKWVGAHFPLKDNTFYTKNKQVYDDSHMKDLYLTKISTITPQKIKSLTSPSNNAQESDSKIAKQKHIAQFGDNEQRDILLKNSIHPVRIALAQYGGGHYHDILMHDKIPSVRAAVALHGSDEHRKILMNDKDDGVRNVAWNYMKDKDDLKRNWTGK